MEENSKAPLIQPKLKRIDKVKFFICWITSSALGSTLIILLLQFTENYRKTSTASSDKFTNKFIEKLFNDTTSYSVPCSNISFALCDMSTCNVDDKNLVAICGCIKMNSSVDSLLGLGWKSPLLATSTTYLEWLELYNKTYTDYSLKEQLQDKLCDILPTLWSSYVGITDSKYISLYGDDSLKNTLSSIVCDKIYGANCQGAPCFDYLYEDGWNVTCLCQLVHNSSYYFDALSSYSNCDILHEDGAKCAVSTSDYSTNIDKLNRAINLIKTSHINLLDDIDSSECPIIT